MGGRVARSIRGSNELVIPDAVVAELGYRFEIRFSPTGEATLLHRLALASWRMEHFVPEDLIRGAELVEKYVDFSLGTVDCLIVAMAERLGATTLFTLDRRHFSAIQPTHCERFEIVP